MKKNIIIFNLCIILFFSFIIFYYNFLDYHDINVQNKLIDSVFNVDYSDVVVSSDSFLLDDYDLFQYHLCH